MINQRWEKRLLRAAKTIFTSKENIALEEFRMENPLPFERLIMVAKDNEGNLLMQAAIIERECEMKNCVKDNEKIMNYLQNENHSGHAHNLDMLLASINLNQHLREAFLSAEVIEDAENNCYTLSFPFGTKMIEYKLSKKAVDAE